VLSLQFSPCFAFLFLKRVQVPDDHSPVHAAARDPDHRLHHTRPGPHRPRRHPTVSGQHYCKQNLYRRGGAVSRPPSPPFSPLAVTLP
jgi:hypothetical protein